MAEQSVVFLPLGEIAVPETRFRKTFTEEAMADLMASLTSPMGLINAITVDAGHRLNTGERRLKAVKTLNDLGAELRFNGKPVPNGMIPVIVVSDTMDEIDLLKAELAENEARDGFTYIEKSQAVTRIAMLEQQILNKQKNPNAPLAPITNLRDISPAAIAATAEKIFDASGGHYSQTVKDSLTITNAMEKNPELAAKLEKAGNITEAKKMLDKHTRDEQHAVLAQTIGKTFRAEMHNVIHGDCLDELKKLPAATFDVCITDPIYGINAHLFGDAANRQQNRDHQYDDSPETFHRIIPEILKLVSRVLKEDAHLYLACAIQNMDALRKYISESGSPNNPWKVQTMPLVQYKIAGGRVPHPGFTYRNASEFWLYAYRGKKQLNHMINSVIECVSDRTETHGAAKPVDLLRTFLRNSSQPGDKCLDFMAGSGGIITACHDAKVRCTAIEISKIYYGRCISRLKELG